MPYTLSRDQIAAYIANADDDPVAGGLFALADAVRQATYRLGTADAATPMGAIEVLSNAMAESAERISGSLSDIASNIDR